MEGPPSLPYERYDEVAEVMARFLRSEKDQSPMHLAGVLTPAQLADEIELGTDRARAHVHFFIDGAVSEGTPLDEALFALHKSTMLNNGFNMIVIDEDGTVCWEPSHWPGEAEHEPAGDLPTSDYLDNL